MARKKFNNKKRAMPLYATDAEWETIKERATASNLTVSEYILACTAIPDADVTPATPGEGLSAEEWKRLQTATENLAAHLATPFPPSEQSDLFYAEEVTPRQAIHALCLMMEK